MAKKYIRNIIGKMSIKPTLGRFERHCVVTKRTADK
jgi:hypothetical protein